MHSGIGMRGDAMSNEHNADTETDVKAESTTKSNGLLDREVRMDKFGGRWECGCRLSDDLVMPLSGGMFLTI